MSDNCERSILELVVFGSRVSWTDGRTWLLCEVEKVRVARTSSRLRVNGFGGTRKLV